MNTLNGPMPQFLTDAQTLAGLIARTAAIGGVAPEDAWLDQRRDVADCFHLIPSMQTMEDWVLMFVVAVKDDEWMHDPVPMPDKLPDLSDVMTVEQFLALTDSSRQHDAARPPITPVLLEVQPIECQTILDHIGFASDLIARYVRNVGLSYMAREMDRVGAPDAAEKCRRSIDEDFGS